MARDKDRVTPLPRFSANITMLFTELSFEDRFAAAAAAGFDAVEIMFPYDFPAPTLAHLAQSAGVEIAMFNAPPGKIGEGEFGLAAVPGDEGRFRESMACALDYAKVLGCPRIHVLAGMGAPNDETFQKTLVDNLKYACTHASTHGVTILIEPISPQARPGYHLAGFEQAETVLKRVGRSNLRLLFDIFHRQLLQGDVLGGIRKFLPVIGHCQVASIPDRHEPNSGELNDARIFEALDALGYTGMVGAEYHPCGDTRSGLDWFVKYRRR